MLTKERRVQILTLFRQGISIRKVALEVGCHFNSVWRVVKKYKDIDDPCKISMSVKKGGRPSLFTPTLDNFLKRTIDKEPRLTCLEIKNRYPDLFQNISVRRIQERLKNCLDRPSRRCAKKPMLSERMKKDRLQFAEKYKYWSKEDWKSVMFSDESTFRLVRNTAGRVRRPVGSDRYEAKYCVKTVKHPDGQMVWGCFSGKVGRGALWFLPQKTSMNGVTYLECLKEKLLVQMKIHGCDSFLQDGAPAHKHKDVQKFLHSRKDFRVLD